MLQHRNNMRRTTTGRKGSNLTNVRDFKKNFNPTRMAFNANYVHCTDILPGTSVVARAEVLPDADITGKGRFSLERPGDLFGDKFKYDGDKTADSIAGVGKERTVRFNLSRNGHLVEAIKPRTVPSFEALQEIDESINGKKVQLSEGADKKKITINIKDKTDTTFRAEGRPQRRVRTEFKLSDVALRSGKIPPSDVLDGIQEAGIEKTQDGKKIVRDLLLKLLDTKDLVDKIIAGTPMNNLKPIVKTAESLVPTDFNAWLPDKRIWSFDGFMKGGDRGGILLFLLSNIPSGQRFSRPVLLKNPKTGDDIPISLATMFKNMRQFGLLLDLQTRSLITKEEAQQLVEEGDVEEKESVAGDVTESDVPEAKGDESDDDESDDEPLSRKSPREFVEEKKEAKSKVVIARLKEDIKSKKDEKKEWNEAMTIAQQANASVQFGDASEESKKKAEETFQDERKDIQNTLTVLNKEIMGLEAQVKKQQKINREKKEKDRRDKALKKAAKKAAKAKKKKPTPSPLEKSSDDDDADFSGLT